MDFKFTYKVRPENLCIISLYGIYRSMAGLVNVIFTISMILLATRFWSETGPLLKGFIFTGILLFPVFQPVFIFLRSRKLVSGMPGTMEMTINRQGIDIASGEKSSRVDFRDLKSLRRFRGMLILYTKSGEAFILDKKTLDGKEHDLYNFLSNGMTRGNE